MAPATLSSFPRLADVIVSTPLPRLSTGIGSVDKLTGGLPRATLTEICGLPSSGRTTLLFSHLRHVTAQGEFCVWVDVQDGFDPLSAVKGGVHLSRLLWVRCQRNVEHAFKATDLLIRAGGFGVVVLDLSGVPDRMTRRIPLATWFRLRHGAEQSGAALIVTGEYMQAGSCSRMQIELRQQQTIWSEKLLGGIEARAGLRKRNHLQSASFRSVR